MLAGCGGEEESGGSREVEKEAQSGREGEEIDRFIQAPPMTGMSDCFSQKKGGKRESCWR